MSTVAYEDTAGKGVAEDKLSNARNDKETTKEIIGATVRYEQMHDYELSWRK